VIADSAPFLATWSQLDKQRAARSMFAHSPQCTPADPPHYFGLINIIDYSDSLP
jgi:hypothetical protein